ncbi:hypothetical protein RJT34_11930 [Clitoria ternatea]|uniref:Uncharacterized protein n=1 Tax=Clitoria ternatea TaxID=43366 RepID=A0AAN9PK00_CLITE
MLWLTDNEGEKDHIYAKRGKRTSQGEGDVGGETPGQSSADDNTINVEVLGKEFSSATSHKVIVDMTKVIQKDTRIDIMETQLAEKLMKVHDIGSFCNVSWSTITNWYFGLGKEDALAELDLTLLVYTMVILHVNEIVVNRRFLESFIIYVPFTL